MHEKLLAILLVIVMFLNTSPYVFAGEVSEDEVQYFICYSETGEILFYNMPIDFVGKTRAEDHTYLKSTVLGTGHATNVDMGYHPSTNICRNVSSYTFSESFSVSMTASINWKTQKFSGAVGVSAAASWGFSFTITADQSRASKIHVYCDFDFKICEGEVRDMNTEELYYTFDYAEFTKTAEEFRVEYRE